MYRLVVLVPFVLALVGCAGLGGGQAVAPDRDMCTLLTSAEVDQYMGWPDTIPESEQGQRGPTCGFTDEDYGTAVRLNLSPVGAIPCDQLKDSPNSDAIGGVGEWAYYSHDRNILYVKKGDSCLEVTAALGVGDPDLDYMTGITELARLAASRL